MKRRDPRERSRAELAAALARSGRERPGLERRGEEPWPGDLFVLAETAGFPVEWLVVERGRQGDCLVVAADTNPALGSADVALPPEAEGGPLSVRCAVDLWIKVECLRRGERTGSVAADDLDRVRRRLAELAAGSPAELEPDPDYEDWLAEVLQPARAALSPAAALDETEEPAVPVRRGAGPADRLAAVVAACILFLAVCGVAVLARRFQQGEQRAWQEVSRLREESRQSEAEHRRELRSLAEDQRRRLAAAAPQQTPAAPAPEAGRPLANLVYASLYPGETRGAVREIVMPPGTTYLFLALSVAAQPLDPEYRVEVEKVAKEQGAAIWSLDGLHPLPTQEVTVALPRAQIPDGAYRIRLFGLRGRERHALGQFEVRIVQKSSETADR